MNKAKKKPFLRRDGAGHIDPRYARELLEKARETQNDDDRESSGRAFLTRPKSTEVLSEELGEAFVSAATSGESETNERLDRITTEENGGPFVVTTAGEEFAAGTDASNIPAATREPLPRTSNAKP